MTRESFVVEVAGAERFRLLLEDAARIAQAEALMAAGGKTVVLGELASGDGGFNAPFQWHLVPSTVEFPEAAIELCDGLPSHLNRTSTTGSTPSSDSVPGAAGWWLTTASLDFGSALPRRTLPGGST